MAERNINETKLLKILSKIAYRVPTDEWDLTPFEYDLLEAANGEEIMSLAYKHGLPIVTMLRNADELVDEHNSRQERQFLRDIKNMKLDLTSDLPRAKKTTVQNTEDIERKLVQESVDEVVGFGPITIEEDAKEIEELIPPMTNVMKEPQGRGVIGKAGFANRHENTSKEISLPSLHRDFQGPPSINIQDVIPTDPDLHNLAAGQDFGDATDEELVQLSMYTGPHSKRLFDRIHSKDVSIEDINRQRKASAAVQDMLPDSSPNIPAPRLSNVLDDKITRQQNDKLVPRLTTARVAKTPTVPSSKDVSLSIGLQTPDNAGFANQTPIDTNVQLAHINDNVPLTPIDMIDMPGPAQQDFTLPAARPKVGAFDGTMMTPVPQQSESRREMFERLANDIGDKLKQKRTPRKKPRRAARPQQPRSEFLELNQPLIFHKRKPKAGQVRMPEPALNMMMDMFEGMDDYDRNDVPDFQDDEPILPEQNQPVLESMMLNLNVQQNRQDEQGETMPNFNEHPQQQMLPPFDGEIVNLNVDALQDQVNHPEMPSTVVQPPPIQSPDASFINKRPRLTLNVDAQTSELSIPVPSKDITAATPALRDITNQSNIETPLESLFQPINMSTALQKPRSGIRRITEAEIEYARLKFISEHNMRKVNVTEQAEELEPSTNAQNLTAGTSKAALAPPPFVPVTEGAVGGKGPGTHEDGRVMFRRFEKNGEWMIEFVGVNGTKEEYSEYCLETIGLYWQIRIIMRQRGTWKMKFAELQPMLSLLKPATPRVIENRVWFIADEGFIKLTFTDDDHIDEVEIKVNEAMLHK